MSMLVWDVVGWTGALALLAAYALVSSGRLTATSGRYTALNLVGAAGLAANGAAHTAWPSVGLNLVWLVIALLAVGRYRRRAGGPPRAGTAPGSHPTGGTAGP